MRWPWTSEPRRETNHVAPLPDGDVYPVAGLPRWADLLDGHDDAEATDATADRNHWLSEHTHLMPVIAPLLTRGQAWPSGSPT
jgi:hypothetical protein